jgi:hypothetical protein
MDPFRRSFRQETRVFSLHSLAEIDRKLDICLLRQPLKGCGGLRLSLHTFSVQNHNVSNQACRATRSTPGDSPGTPFGVLSTTTPKG